MRSPDSRKQPQRSPGPEAPGAARHLPTRRDAVVFALTIFLSAFLLFQVQPLLGKYILPWFGGAPAVWTTCLLFFQALLLVGYGYAHGLRSRTDQPRQGQAHIALLIASVALLLVLAFLWPSPITPGGAWKPTDGSAPIRHILLLLTASVAVPYLILASTGPLLQHWCARLWPEASPYRLYAVSNLGSLLGLLTYPFVFEPLLTLRAQARLWSFGYLVFVLGCAVCANLAARATTGPKPAKVRGPAPALHRGEVLLWFSLAACGSLMLLATTNLMTQDVAAVPLLWILPLSLYLLSFILCFGSGRWYQRWLFHPLLAVAAVLAVLALLGEDIHTPVRQIAFLAVVVFAACMVLHGELSRRKPEPHHLTAYYLVIAAGGAAGGAFTTLVAPHLFPTFWEFHLGLWLTALLLALALFSDRESWLHDHSPWLPPGIVLGTLAIPGVLTLVHLARMEQPFARGYIIALGLAMAWTASAVVFARKRPAARFRWIQVCVLGWLALLGYVLVTLAQVEPGNLVARSRSFYGVLSVWEVYRGSPLAHAYKENNGHIHHGMQLRDPAISRTATSYYGVGSGAGLALLYHPRRLMSPPGSLRIGAVGLGVGTIAVYAQPGDSVRFYEINPDVIRFAGRYFSYLSQCKGTVEVVPGDARLSLERELEQGERQRFDVLVVDAFSSDAIPLHLLTSEAFSLYLKHLSPDGGIIAIHVTNRSLDLEPVVARQAEHFGLHSAFIHSEARGTSIMDSDWILLSYSPAILTTREIASAARPLTKPDDFPLWTDQYSNLFSVLH